MPGTGTSAFARRADPALPPSSHLPPDIPLLPVTLLKTVGTSNLAWNPSSPDPSGIDYWPLTGRMLVVDSEVDEMPAYFTGVNIFDARLDGSLVSTCSTTDLDRSGWSNEPTGLAINPSNNRLYISDDFRDKVFELSLGPDNTFCTPDDVVTSVGFHTDTEDVAYGDNQLFIAGGSDAAVYRFDLGRDGVLGGGDDGPITHWSTAPLGFHDLEGIAYNPDRGTLFILSTQANEEYMGEVTPAGQLLRAYDLSAMGRHNNIRSDVTYAPSSFDPSQKSIYIVSRGLDNDPDPSENDGKWWEFSLGPLPGPFTRLSPRDGSGSQPLLVTLSWSAAPDAQGYELCIDTSDDGDCRGWLPTGPAASVYVGGLACAQTYYWQVRAVGGGGYTYADGSPASFRSFTTLSSTRLPHYGHLSLGQDHLISFRARPDICSEGFY